MKREYGIWRTTFYYAGTYGARPSGWVLAEDGHPVAYDTREEAARAAEQIYVGGGEYRLQHGEYAQPHYELRLLPLDYMDPATEDTDEED